MKNNPHSPEELYLAPEKSAAAKDTVPAEESPAAEQELCVQPPVEGVHALQELTDLRQDNCKVFRMSDGTRQVVLYPEPVHVYNADTDTFDEVDTALAEEEDGVHYRGGNGRFTARFSREETDDELFSVEQGMHRLTVNAQQPQRQRGRGVKPRVQRPGADNAGRERLVFDRALREADLEYTVTDTGVKENIVIREKAPAYRYPFMLTCQSLAVTLREEDNVVCFLDPESGDEVFRIPAPFMVDAAGARSDAVTYELRQTGTDSYAFTVMADSDWINAEGRAFPVTVDPAVEVSGSSKIACLSWWDDYVRSNNSSTFKVGCHQVYTETYCESDSGCDGSYVGSYVNKAHRMYLGIAIPTLPRNPRIIKAELVLTQSGCNSSNNSGYLLTAHEVYDTPEVGYYTPAHSPEVQDFTAMQAGANNTYTFDVTAALEKTLAREETTLKLLIKAQNESTATTATGITLYGSNVSSSSLKPQLKITYDAGYAIGGDGSAHTHQLGQFAQAAIDLRRGTLTFDAEDFAWAGNRMPVTIRHQYHSALAGDPYTSQSAIALNTAYFGGMQLGYGWRLNVMESMVRVGDRYVYMDENGGETWFNPTDTPICDETACVCDYLYKEADDSDTVYDPVKRTLTSEEEVRTFDTAGRLIAVTDGKNTLSIHYTSGRITSVVDGAGRVFGFNYSGNALSSIIAPDGTAVTYAYTNGNLTAVTAPTGDRTEITYDYEGQPAAVLLKNSAGESVYKVTYAFDYARQLCTVTEYGVDNGAFVQGARTDYSYFMAARRTKVTVTEPKDTEAGETTDTTIVTNYAFDEEGNVVSQYATFPETGTVAVENTGAGGIHPYAGDEVHMVSNADNLLKNHRFNTLSNWTQMPANYWNFVLETRNTYLYYGKQSLYMRSEDAAALQNGVYQNTAVTLPAGDYTFSAYARVARPFATACDCCGKGAYLRVTTTGGTLLAESEHVGTWSGEFTRLTASFTLTAATVVQTQLLVDGKGSVYWSGAQLERCSYANPYNLMENGGFEFGSTGWNTYGGSFGSNANNAFNMKGYLQMWGSLTDTKYAYQDIPVLADAGTRESFTLSGWARCYGTLSKSDDLGSLFRLRAVIHYTDGTTQTVIAPFVTRTEEWNFASVDFAKEKHAAVNYIRVYSEYGQNDSTALFDNIQLTRTGLETGLEEADFDTDTAEEETTVTEEYTPPETPAFEELLDAYGNPRTETTFHESEFGSIYRAFGYAHAGNDLVRETDARGNETTYTVDPDTSRNEEVTDRCGNKTAYEYDAAGRTTKVTSKDTDGNELAHVSYAYNAFDDLTAISRGDGMGYTLGYTPFHQLETIGVAGKPEPLVTYRYKNGNGRLKAVTYANGHTMRATYNGLGQMVAEKWYDGCGTLMAHYKYVYDNGGNLTRSIDIFSQKEYTYTYEDGKLLRATESAIEVNSDGIVTVKTPLHSLEYTYNAEGELTRKVFVPREGDEITVQFEKSGEDNSEGRTVARFTAGGRSVVSRSKTDGFGRKEYDELQLGLGLVYRRFTYHKGEVTQEHRDNSKMQSAPTTQLVKEIELSDGRTIAYEYDAEERITKVTDSVDGTTVYTYDALGQLLTETVNGTVINLMTYDSYGNILCKNGNAYTYDSVWKDLLTSYNGQAITYDAQGNPTNYLGHTLQWEKGRQLTSFDSNTYTYNANGIRTSKTVDGIRHDFVLDGATIVKETWADNELIPLHDNEDSVCGIQYNGSAFYFLKNQQGDVIVLTDGYGNPLARYTYDAWGKLLSVTDKNGNAITSAEHIAHINPSRYRGYYYDREIGMYYLQSRYYDPEVGRFINADTAEVLEYPSTFWETNLFSYCNNNPTNDTDRSGLFLASKLAQIFLSAVFGMVAQLFDDFTIYFLQVLIHGKKNAKLNPNPSDYVSRALAWAFECINPFSGKKKWLNVIFAVVPLIVKTIWDLVAGKGFNLWSFLRNIFYSLASVIIANVLGRQAKNRISQLKKRYRGKKPAFKAKKLQIRAKYKVLGNRITTTIDIAEAVVETALAVLFI